jgi:hypothetical protein
MLRPDIRAKNLYFLLVVVCWWLFVGGCLLIVIEIDSVGAKHSGK